MHARLPVSFDVPPSASLRGDVRVEQLTPDSPSAPLRGEPGVRTDAPPGHCSTRVLARTLRAPLGNKAMKRQKQFNQAMNKVILYLLMPVFSVVLGCGWCDRAKADPLRSPSLSEVVLIGLRPAGEINQANYPKAGQTCVRKYLDAIAPDSNLWAFEVPSSPDKAVLVRRRNLIEQMVSILGQDVRNAAEAFAYAAPLMTEWEGMSEGPVDEANFVDNWLEKRPRTPIAPFLCLFKAHRLRTGYETARARHEKDLWPILARRYREAIDEARSSTNLLISCIADDLEAQPFVYLEGQGRP